MFFSDFYYMVNWWFLFLIFGIVLLPTTYLFFKRFFDTGYGFSKTVGLLAVSYLIFILSTFKIVPFTRISIIFILFIFLIFNIHIFLKYKDNFLTSFKKRIKIIIFQEIYFTLGFSFWCMIRGYQPDINGLEKFMDYGFVNSILRSNYLPPADMWFAGETINYYWFGHFLTALATKLSNIPSEITYNLMLATLLGLTLTGIFSLVTTLFEKINLKFKKIAVIAGILSSLLVTFGGNFHTPFYVLKNGKENYWYPDATRFIGYNPETNDKTIHEFPIYSFVVSDLHAHLINLPVVILFISLLYKSITSKKTRLATAKILPLGSLLGIMFMTSTWDFGNYLILTGISTLAFYIFKSNLTFQQILKSGLFLVGTVTISILTALPFIINFTSIAKGIDFVNAHTPLWQLGILWGFPAILTLLFTINLTKIKIVKNSDLYVAVLLCSSWILIVIPEILYVKDIYIASHHRANTMFKLTYQAFVMSYITSGYIALRFINSIQNIVKKTLAILTFTILFASVLWYPKFAINSYYHNLKNYIGLNGTIWLKEENPDLYFLIKWFNKNIKGQPVILEAPGDSYTEYNVISSYTGLPTVSGWFVHEWLWRGDSSFPQKRVTDITEIYTNPNQKLTRSLLEKYKVEYVIIGKNERQKFPNIDEKKFNELGTMVFENLSTKVYKIN